ncbi:MAG: energy transducer TonB [Gemmatimonadales bacterium]
MRDARTHGRTEARGDTFLRAAVPLCLCAFLISSCRSAPTPETAAAKENDVPVAINSESPFQYPADLYDQGVEGEVRLRLYVDDMGRVHPESTKVASSSGTPELDSAAVRGAALLRFAPAHKDGQSISTAFYQPVIFRRSGERAAAPAP